MKPLKKNKKHQVRQARLFSATEAIDKRNLELTGTKEYQKELKQNHNKNKLQTT